MQGTTKNRNPQLIQQIKTIEVLKNRTINVKKQELFLNQI